MIFIGTFEELYPGEGYPPMKTYMMERPYEGQEQIVRFLRTGKVFAVAPGRNPRDVFTGERIAVEPEIKMHGDYAWSSALPYYVSKYNVRLPEHIERMILSMQ